MSYEFNTQNNAAPSMLKPHFHYCNVSWKKHSDYFSRLEPREPVKESFSSLQNEAFHPSRICAAIRSGQRSQHVKIVAWHPFSLIYNACQYPEQLLNTDCTTLSTGGIGSVYSVGHSPSSVRNKSPLEAEGRDMTINDFAFVLRVLMITGTKLLV